MKKANPLVIIGILVLVLNVIGVAGCGLVRNSYNNSLNNNGNNNNKSEVQGAYTREIFSNNAFDYKTRYENALFEFSSDSTFEFTFEGGITYRGIYEVYNGLMIPVKAREIEADPNIYYAYSLAEDIRNVSYQMMTTPEAILNTYLLYIKALEVVEDGISGDVEILQPFVVYYEPSTNTGVAVNIMELMRGSFTMR